MNRLVLRLSAIFMAVLLLPLESFATCGGGGGGGMGASEQVYQVPWKVADPKNAPPAGGLTLYWFPSSLDEYKNSSLRNSRSLTLYATQCVNMTVSDTQTPEMQKLVGDKKLPVAVLARNDGTAIAKAENV